MNRWLGCRNGYGHVTLVNPAFITRLTIHKKEHVLVKIDGEDGTLETTNEEVAKAFGDQWWAGAMNAP